METEIINVEPDNNGRVIIELYGQKLEIHESMFDEEGHALLKKFGKHYEIVKPIKKKRTRRKKTVEPEPEIVVESGLEAQESASNIESGYES